MKRIAIGLLVLFVAVAVGVSLYIDRIVSEAIERGAMYALGVQTEVGFVRLQLLDGSFRLRSLRVANPPGFDEPHFLRLGSAGVDVDLSTVRRDVVEVPLFALDGIDVALEREGSKTNYGVILHNLKRFESGKAPEEAKPSGPQKRFIVRQLLIADVKALLEWSRVASDQTAFTVSIPEIRLRDIGAHKAQGVAMAELTNIVVKAVLGAIAKHGTNLPGAVLGQLRSGVGALSSVSSEVVFGVGGEGVEKIADAAAEELEGVVRDQVGKAVSEKASQALKGVGGLIGERDGED